MVQVLVIDMDRRYNIPMLLFQHETIGVMGTGFPELNQMAAREFEGRVYPRIKRMKEKYRAEPWYNFW